MSSGTKAVLILVGAFILIILWAIDPQTQRKAAEREHAFEMTPEGRQIVSSVLSEQCYEQDKASACDELRRRTNRGY
jgi:hypothetical protein